AGPIGCEMAQSFARFGSQVTVLQSAGRIMDREDADAVKRVEKAFAQDGIRVVTKYKATQVEKRGSEKVIRYEADGKKAELVVDEILVGVGRSPNVEGLDLEKVGVEYDAKTGVHVNDQLQTTNPRIYAAGDISSRFKFTHAAEALAAIVIQNALFKMHKTASALVIPWCTYTDPEVAHVGLYGDQAEKLGIPVQTFVHEFHDVDRAILDGEEDGFVKVHVKKGTDQILGATIVARHAGEMIGELTLAMTAKIGLRSLAGVIHPYPTQAEAIKRTGGAYYKSKLTPFVKGAMARWMAWTR
ncbi:MAG: FAD-dependent oxidoreductase, partial [Elusimicrobia bacterium]|nr:FAD-dependent oxidoreductase [Elusimicrobiota bacterium]